MDLRLKGLRSRRRGEKGSLHISASVGLGNMCNPAARGGCLIAREEIRCYNDRRIGSHLAGRGKGEIRTPRSFVARRKDSTEDLSRRTHPHDESVAIRRERKNGCRGRARTRCHDDWNTPDIFVEVGVQDFGVGLARTGAYDQTASGDPEAGFEAIYQSA
jgi:hypothetical protein